MSWKNKILTALCQLKQRAPSPEIRRILVVSTTALGDTLWATPALSNLRKRYPDAHIAVLTTSTGKQVFKSNPDINELHLLKEPLLPRFYSLWNKLSKGSYDIAFIFHASQRLALPLCALSGIPRIVGTKGLNKGLDDLLTDPIDAIVEHEIERRLRLVSHIGAAKKIQTLSYFVESSEREEAKKFIGTSKKIKIAMHPGSKEPFRRWPAEHFAKVGKALQEEFDCEIFLTGDRKELPLLNEIKELLPSVRLANSQSSIRHLGAFLEQMDLLISNDTGPLHLACALNRPIVGIYVSTDPRLCGPHLAKNACTVSRAPTCSPCIKRRCHSPFCFLQIPPQEVIFACKSLL